VAGESVLFVDPAEIPASSDVARLGQALTAGRRRRLDELMAHTAAYTACAGANSPPSPSIRSTRRPG
jgi:hypothetical protein